MRAVGFKKIGRTEEKPNGWSVPSRPRKKAEKYPEGQKIIWEIKKGGAHGQTNQDKGAAVKGNAIDVYFESHEEALVFGRQIVRVYVKEESK